MGLPPSTRNSDPDEADCYAEQRPRLRPRVVGSAAPKSPGPQVIDEHDPQRGRADHQRDQARGHALLCPDHRAVAACEQEQPDDGRRAPLDSCGRGIPAHAAKRIEDAAGNHEPDAGRRKRRHRLDDEADCEVCRSPDEINRAQRGPDRSARSLIHYGTLSELIRRRRKRRLISMILRHPFKSSDPSDLRSCFAAPPLPL